MSCQWLKLVLAPGAWRVLRSTIGVGEFDSGGEAERGPFIFACLHRDILPAIMYVRSAHPALLVSDSADGDILVKALGQNEYHFVRGATGGDGRRALVLLRRELKEGHSVGLAVDGPEGPFGSIREGVLYLSKMTGTPIVPLVARVDRPLVLNTWDRTVVPIPFRRAAMERGAIMRVRSDAAEKEMKEHLRRLAEFFDVVEEG